MSLSANTDAVAGLLAALDKAGFEPTGDGLFRPVGRIPDSFARRFPGLCADRVDLDDVFPFVANFRSDADELWNGDPGREAAVKSGFWTETDAAGEPCRLEATALRTRDARLLLIEVVDEKHDRIRAILQAAREHGLDLEKRTEQLVATNRTLEREIAGRQRANDRLRELAERLAIAEERERRRIATDLHDHVGQSLAVAKIRLGMLAEEAASTALVTEIRFVRSLIEETIAHTRSLTFELAPPALHELGLEAALEGLASRARERYALAASYADDGANKPLEPDTRTILFQSALELLHNVAKHARAASVRITTRRVPGGAAAAAGDAIALTVEDDGEGMSPPPPPTAGHEHGFGLFNVRERIEHLGGAVAIRSTPGDGTRVELTAPLAKGAS